MPMLKRDVLPPNPVGLLLKPAVLPLQLPVLSANLPRLLPKLPLSPVILLLLSPTLLASPVLLSPLLPMTPLPSMNLSKFAILELGVEVVETVESEGGGVGLITEVE